MGIKQELIMRSKLFRKLTSIILVVAMIVSNGAFAQLPPVVQAATEGESSWEENGVHYRKYVINAGMSLAVKNGSDASKVQYTKDAEAYTIGRGRVFYVQYDLSPVASALTENPDLNVYEAQIKLTKKGSNGNNTELRYIPDSSWAEDPGSATWNSMEALLPGGQFGDSFIDIFSTRGLTTNGVFSANATRAITRENISANGSKFSFSLTGAITSGNASGDEDGLDAYAVTCSTENYRPYIEVTLADKPQLEIDRDQNGKRAQSAMDILSSTYAGLSLDSDLSLPSDYFGVDIAWKSSKEEALAITKEEDEYVGRVTRQDQDGDDVRVVLTATCSYGEGDARVSVDKEFKLTVVKENDNLYPLDIVGIQNSGNRNTTLRDTTAEVGRGRSIVARFDISQIPDGISGAYVHIANVSGNNNTIITSKVFTLSEEFDVATATHNKIFANDQYDSFQDGVEGEFIGGAVTIPKKNTTGELEVTRAIRKAKKAGQSTIVIGFAGDWTGDGTGKVATNTWLEASQKTYLHYESSTEVKNVEAALKEASAIDGKICYDDFEIPVDTAAGAVITWESDSEYAQIDGSTVHIRRPSGDKDAEVTFTVTAAYENVSETRTYTIIIPTSKNIVSPYLRDSLERMIRKAGQLLDLAVADHTYTEKELSEDFNQYLLQKTVPVYEANGVFTEPTTQETYDLVKKTDATVPRIDVTIEDEERQLGQLSKERYQELSQAYDAAVKVYEDGTEARYSAEIQSLLRAGYEFVKSGKTDDSLYTNKVSASDLWIRPAVASDDTGVDSSANGFNNGARRYEKVTILPGDELAYSSYRAYEEALVWKAYALLAIEPELYPQSAKDALMEKVGDAEKALEGTYYIMYSKSRQFFQSRPDEQIQRTTLYQDKSWNFEDFEYGLAPCLAWYRKQSRAAEVSYVLRGGIDPGTLSFELVTNTSATGSISNNFSNSSWLASGLYNPDENGNTTNYRVTYMQYNLDKFTDIAPVYSAELWSTNTQTGYCLGEYRLEENKASSEYTPNENNGEWLYKMTQRAQYSTVKVCVLDGVLKRVYAGEDKVTFSLRNIDPAVDSDGVLNGKTDVYSSRADTTDEKKGQLYVVLEKINQKALSDEIDAEIEEQTTFLTELKEEGKLYTGSVANAVPGAYPKELADKVQKAMDDLKQAKSSAGDWELCALLKQLDDAVLTMKDAIVLSTDIDPENNLFFSKEETEALKEKIANDPELERAYTEMKAIANRNTGEEMMQMRYDKLDNDPDTLKSGYKMWYGASNQNMQLAKDGQTNVAKAYITVTLPAKLNEATEENAGHVWFDNIVISATSGREMVVPNNIFRYSESKTKPANWNAYVYDAETGDELVDLAKGTYKTEIEMKDEAGKTVGTRKTPLNPNGSISDYVKFQQGDARLASSGSNSIYLCNPTGETYSVWKSDVFDYPVDDYTMSFQVKQEKKFNVGGVEVQFHYLDKNNNPVGESKVFSTDVIGNISGYTSSNMMYQCATVAYMITGEEKYAKLAKACMYTYMEEALLGAHSWENNYRHGRPTYGDVFGAVQNGRSGATLGTMYAVMKNVRLSNGAPLWTIEEKKQLVEQIRLFCGNLLDIRDRTHIDVMDVAEGISNWETDQSMGASMLGMAFAHDNGQEYTDEEVIAAGYVTEDGKADRTAMEEDITLPYGERYIQNTTHIIKGTMFSEIRDDGAWPESLNYHGAMLEKLASYSVASRYAIGVDFFTITRDYEDQEEQKDYGRLSTLAKMLKYYAVVQAPRYVNGNACDPGFGDGHYYSGANYKYAGTYWREMYDKYLQFKQEGDTEKAEAYHELARDLYGCWNRAGRQRPQQANEENVMQFFFVDSEWPEDDQDFLDTYSENQKSSGYMKYFGTYIMRNNFDVKDERTGQYKESYVAIMAQPKATGHNHYDEGSFLLHSDGVPLVTDPGMDNYWSAGKKILLSSQSHSTVQVKQSETAYADVATSVKDTEFYTSDKMDKLSTTLSYQSNVAGEVERNYAFVKDGFEAHVIWDRVSGATMGSRMNLVLYTEMRLPDKFTGNKIIADGFSNANLEITVLQGNVDSYNNSGPDQIKATGGLSSRPGEVNCQMDILRIENEGNDNYLTVLFPTNDMGTRGTLTTSEVEVSPKGKVDGYKLSHDNGKHAVYVAVNDRKTAETITLPEKVRLLNNEEGTVYEAKEEIAIQSGEMLLFSTNLSEEALETGTDEPKKADTSSPTQPSQSTPSTGGAAGGAISGGASNAESEIVKGNANKVDLSVPGISGTPYAKVAQAAEEGVFQLDVENSYTAYYSVNDGEYMKYTGPVSVADGDKIVYFTVNDKTGLKTCGVRYTATAGKKPKMPAKYGVAVGKRNKLRIYNAKGATDIKYKVANKKIAAVSRNGSVRGKKLGNTKVTVTFMLNGQKYTLKTLIKVKKTYNKTK